MIFIFRAGVKFKIAFHIEQNILLLVCSSETENLWLPTSLIFFHLNPTRRGGEDGNRAHTPLYPVLFIFLFFENMSVILFYKCNKLTLLYVLFFFTKIAWRIRVKYKRGESNPCLPEKWAHPPQWTYLCAKIGWCISQKVNEVKTNLFLWT